jgi:diguanylate cyclase (GGDEF)-like protein
MSELEPRRAGDAAPGCGWLCPTESHRARMLDMGPRVIRARNIAIGAVGVGMFLTIGDLGWTALPLFGIALLNLATLDRRIERSRRPERVVAGSLLLMMALIGAAAALTDVAVNPVLALIVIPVGVTAARFRSHVVWAAACIAALMALLATVAGDPQKMIDHPLMFATVLVLLVGVTAVTTALMDAEWQFRNESALDPLTGLLNRSGLEARFAELGEQAQLLDQPVCLIMCDLDNFKRVNDDYGHERGDAVLREVSVEMRNSLRSFELFYRLGGEEFLVLLPGIDLPQGIEIAESLRAAVERTDHGDVTITSSLGVSVATGAGIEFLPLYRAADGALYRAKHAGRNQVAAAGMRSLVAA